LKIQGYRVTTFHNVLPELSSWFPGHDLQVLPSVEKLLSAIASFDMILVENDNSPKIKQLIEAFRPTLSIFYPTYSESKHGLLSPQDRAFDKDMPMADNIAQAIASLIDLPATSKGNGLFPFPHLVHRAKKGQVVFHPTSRETAKNWKSSGFLVVARELKKRGFSPVFCTSPKERPDWQFVEEEGFALANLPTLSDLASLIYESGYVIGNDSLIGHLGSNLNIPTLIIANDEKRMQLWRPGWLKGGLVLPPAYLPNWKCLRLKEKKWQHFITPSKVLNAFDELISAF
jgi:heptosyltransferase III